jgi:hypothetical protein
VRRIEVDQLTAPRAAATASEPALDLIEADLPAKLLSDLQRNEAGEVAALRLSAPRNERRTRGLDELSERCVPQPGHPASFYELVFPSPSSVAERGILYEARCRRMFASEKHENTPFIRPSIAGTRMIKLPETLRPTTTITIALDDGRQLEIPKATPCFKRWHGEPIIDTYGYKPMLDHSGEPLFAELVILRHLQIAGWQGVWIDTYRRKFLIAPRTAGVVPENALSRLEAIYERAGSRYGCFDVFAWSGTDLLFAEAKHRKKDPIRPSQRKWLAAALDLGIPLSSLLVVEWNAD